MVYGGHVRCAAHCRADGIATYRLKDANTKWHMTDIVVSSNKKRRMLETTKNQKERHFCWKTYSHRTTTPAGFVLISTPFHQQEP